VDAKVLAEPSIHVQRCGCGAAAGAAAPRSDKVQGVPAKHQRQHQTYDSDLPHGAFRIMPSTL